MPRVKNNLGKMQIVNMSLSKLKDAEYNPRSIKDENMEGLVGSIENFGLLQPIIWNKKTGNVVGGHQRKKVLEKNKVKTTDVVVVELSLEKEKALNVALNNDYIQGEWEFQDLSVILKELQESNNLDLTFMPEHELGNLLNAHWEKPIIGEMLGEEHLRDEKINKKIECPQCGYKFSNN